MDYLFYQQYWWFIISLLGGILVFLLFVQGGQSLLYQIGKSDEQRSMIINSLGRKWEFTFTTLVTFGGAFFASFPLFYSTSFGGAYWVWIAILFCFIVQAIAYEFRTKAGNVLGKRTYEVFLLINGFGGLILLGVAVGTFFTGAEFIVEKNNITEIGAPIISQWRGAWGGFEAILDPRNLLLGLAILFLARTSGAAYLLNNIEDQELNEKARHQIIINAIPFLLFFLAFFIWTLFAEGFAVDPVTKEVSRQGAKIGLNLLAMPCVATAMTLGVALLLGGIWMAMTQKAKSSIWLIGLGTVIAVTSLLLTAGWNNTSFYPSLSDLQSSLTIENSSSSLFTLKVMSVVSLLIPFVVAYIFYAWRSIDQKKIQKQELNNSDQHLY